MREGAFSSVAANSTQKNWMNMVKRQEVLYERENDIRTEFYRDYTRILHSLAYRRLKHKTQVFFNTKNDHVCTRIEHVNHVESVSYTISKQLGLNTELTSAIAIGHDLGHAPFGHEGEVVLSYICKENAIDSFWHEKNGLFIVDNIELLEDDKRELRNLNLTYAVRDGIISHCGEIDQNALYPRESYIDLVEFDTPNKFQPYTWEACIVKISDKIAYLGRDIEDAYRLKFIGDKELYGLKKIAKEYGVLSLNTTQIMHQFILNLCQKSSPDKGIMLSDEDVSLMNKVKAFNYENIYKNPKFSAYKEFVKLIINTLYCNFDSYYDGKNTINCFISNCDLSQRVKFSFVEWLALYTNDNSTVKLQVEGYKMQRHRNKWVYDLNNHLEYQKCIIGYISGMSDNFAYTVFEEITSF